MSVNYKKLGTGSLLCVDEASYCVKSDDGMWHFLDPSVVAFTDDEVDQWSDAEVILTVEVSYLHDFPVGSVITFDKGDVAVRHREDFWRVAGSDEEYTFEQLENYIFNKNTIKELR